MHRDVAQLGSALAWGARGREFESRRPDHFYKTARLKTSFFNVYLSKKSQ